VLPWSLDEKRPFLRILHGCGIGRWRPGRLEEAEASFAELLRLKPMDSQGARFCLPAVGVRPSWDAFREDEDTGR
jgi:hypothetical protein